MLAGDDGPATQLAMSILVRMADVYGASELMDVSQAHIDSTIYLGDATLEFAERLASLGARVAVPTSLNVSGVDECGWKDWAVSPEWAAKAARQMLAYEKMGASPTWTCAPYQTKMRPIFGQQVAWGGTLISNDHWTAYQIQSATPRQKRVQRRGSSVSATLKGGDLFRVWSGRHFVRRSR